MTSAELLGIPIPLTWKDRTLQICSRDLHCEGIFGTWVAAEAALSLARLKSRVPADFYAEQMRIYSAKLAGKQYEWGSEEAHAAAWSEAGQKHLLWLKIQRGQAKGGAPLDREELDEIWQDADKRQELLDAMWRVDYPDFFAAVQKDREMKNPLPPGEAL